MLKTILITIDIHLRFMLDEQPELDEMPYKSLRALVERFMTRYNLTLRASNKMHQSYADQAEDIASFYEELCDLMNEEGIAPEDVYNMDETGVNFELTPSKIVAFKGETNVHYKTGGKDKLRATVILLVRYGWTEGQQLPKPFIIFRGSPTGPLARGFSAHNNKQDARSYVVFQKNAWADSNNLKTWCKEVYWKTVLPREKTLLLADNFSAHVNTLEKHCIGQEDKDNVMFFPPNCTHLLQPLDLGVNRIFKNELRKKWVQNQNVTVTREILVTWVEECWS
jgi:hypothetical protein